MTDEKLELHKRLQKLYKEKMGDFLNYHQYGRVYCQKPYNPTLLIDCDYICPVTNKDCKHRLYLPLPIDPVNPERGLWGMVCWKKWLQESTEVDGEILIFQRMSDGGKQFTSDPEEALLKALCEQEGL
jgi:hypothetical protein